MSANATIAQLIPNIEFQKEEREVGIEIEMEGSVLPSFEMNYWRVTTDGSLRGNAYEYVMNRPCSRENILPRLRYLKRVFDIGESTPSPSNRCGVHVHINCQNLTLNEVLNFACLYLIFEDVLVRYCGESRQGNLFCLRAKDAEMLIYALSEVRRTSDISFISDDNYRYASINLEALRKYGSVEFRSLKTPQNIEDIATWVRLLLRVKDASLQIKETRDLVETISRGGLPQFVQSVFQEDVDLLLYDGIEKDIIEGVRRVQDIAYIPWGTGKKEEKKRINGIGIEELQGTLDRYLTITGRNQTVRLQEERPVAWEHEESTEDEPDF